VPGIHKEMAGRGSNRRKQDAGVRAAALRQGVARVCALGLRLGLAGVLAAGLYWGGTHLHLWATSSPTFALQDVKVSGGQRVTDAELLRLGGLAFGQNLFRLDPPALERALAAHPWVRQVRVTRHFPTTLSIEVDEYAPAALVSLGELYLVDLDGTPFKKLQAGDALDLPLLTGLDREAYVADPGRAAQRMRGALALADGFGEPVSEVRMADEGMTVVTGKGVEVRMGFEHTPEKLARLSKVQAELGRRGLQAEVIHLDNRVRPGWITVKLPNPHSERRGSVQ
jgi:cell division protein FtsQ